MLSTRNSEYGLIRVAVLSASRSTCEITSNHDETRSDNSYADLLQYCIVEKNAFAQRSTKINGIQHIF